MNDLNCKGLYVIKKTFNIKMDSKHRKPEKPERELRIEREVDKVMNTAPRERDAETAAITLKALINSVTTRKKWQMK